MSVLPVGMGSSGVDVGDIGHSLRLRASASAYLNRTFGTPTNQAKWTWSGWVKKAGQGVQQNIIHAYNSGAPNNRCYVAFDSGDNILSAEYAGGAYPLLATTNAKFRDPIGHYHVHIIFDSANGTVADRFQIWVNGTRQTFSGSPTYPSAAITFNSANIHTIGRDSYSTSNYLDGYLSRVCFIDGQALTPDSFGYQNTAVNEWVSKSQSQVLAVVEAGGTNSFMLDFDDATSLTTLGYDKSSKNNDWTLNNFSLTAGTIYDHMLDVPGNSFATLNPLDQATATITNGNLTQTGSWGGSRGTQAIPSTGKYYFEGIVTSACTTGVAIGFGICTSSTVTNTSGLNSTGAYGMYTSNGGNIVANGANGSAITSFSAGEVLQVAVDVDNSKVWLGRGNVWYNSTAGTTGDPSTGANPTFTIPASGMFLHALTYGNTINVALGQAPLHASATYHSAAGGYFRYAPPTGFLALCQSNLPEAGTVTVSGSFTGNAAADGPFVWMNGVPLTLTINGNAVTFGTHADKTAGGFKLRTSSSSYNAAGTNNWTATITSDVKNLFKYRNAQGNP